ncbi:MAG: phosphoribosylformylglycinamidine synthase subunit PurL, partial [Candidatus Bathyarchaeia archaeon]
MRAIDELPEVSSVDILELNEKGLLELSRRLTLNLTLEELLYIKDHFRKLGRAPTDVEIQAIAQTWSEHCYHKTFKARVSYVNGARVDSIFRTFIYKATEELNRPWCVDVFKDNAGIVEFEDGFWLAAKVETHNHPSAIEPFGGAATGVGGVIRDILGVWAEPIACTDVLCFGPLNTPYESLPRGVKHPKYIFKGVISGIGSYGNNMGIPTVSGAVVFDRSYTGNVVVFCGCLGILPSDKFVRKTSPGDLILLVGGKTGRDGIHGATFSSFRLTSESELSARSAVQIPNPIEEEKLARAVIRVRDLGLASGITDLGAGGISSAVGEMANRSSCGAVVELEKVPLKAYDLLPWEIFLSESQERMLLSVPPNNIHKVLRVFAEEEVEATVIGIFTDERKLRVKHGDKVVGDLDMGFLFNPPILDMVASLSEHVEREPDLDLPRDLQDVLMRLLGSPNISSKEKVVRTYDQQVRGNTVLTPFLGLEPMPCDAAVIKPLEISEKCISLSCGINPRYGKIDPYWMAASSIDEAIRNNVSVGGRRICLLDNFVWGDPWKPEELGGILEAARACYDFSKAFGTPFISGKDSLHNESPLGPVTPTIMITAIGIVPEVKRIVTPKLKTPGDGIFLVGLTRAELGGSEYYDLMGCLGNSVPKVDTELAPLVVSRMIKAIDLGLVSACHDLSEGGLGVAAAEMSLSPRAGVEIDIRRVPSINASRDDVILFSESNTRFLVEVPSSLEDEFRALMSGVPHARVGQVVQQEGLRVIGTHGSVVIDVEPED